MAKDWKDMTVDEKLEGLRADIAKEYELIKSLNSSIHKVADQTSAHLTELQNAATKTNAILKEVAKDVSGLKSKQS